MNDIQHVELNILKEVIRILDNNNLRYFVTGGTLIGAIRHKGFIPWDDDVDIGMPRNDYELFRTKICHELPSYLRKIDCDDNEEYAFIFSKVHDVRTTYIGEYCKDYPGWYTGVFIDIFPYDGLPDSNPLKYIRKIHFLKQMNGLRRNGVDRNDPATGIKRAYKRFVSAVVKMFVPYNYFSNKILIQAMKYDFDKSRYVYSLGGFVPGKEEKYIREREWYGESKCKFENIDVTIPSGYDQILRLQYGDYMKIPPEDQRISHSIFYYDLNLPIEEYRITKKGI